MVMDKEKGEPVISVSGDAEKAGEEKPKVEGEAAAVPEGEKKETTEPTETGESIQIATV